MNKGNKTPFACVLKTCISDEKQNTKYATYLQVSFPLRLNWIRIIYLARGLFFFNFLLFFQKVSKKQKKMDLITRTIAEICWHSGMLALPLLQTLTTFNKKYYENAVSQVRKFQRVGGSIGEISQGSFGWEGEYGTDKRFWDYTQRNQVFHSSKEVGPIIWENCVGE